MIYLSDYGETLGENGKWLYAGSGRESQNPACLVWYSDEYRKRNPLKVDALYKNINRRLRTDFLYPSILDAGNTSSKVIDNSQDIFYLKK